MTVAIVGAAESDLGSTNRSILNLQAQATIRALADARLRLDGRNLPVFHLHEG